MLDAFESACIAARKNALSPLEHGKELPDRVLDASWRDVQFFYADVAALSMLPIFQSLMKIERSTLCYLADLEGRRTQDRLDGFCISLDTKAEDFLASWLEGGRLPRFGRMSNHSCASEKGEWFLYAQRPDDLCFLAFKERSTAERYGEVLSALRAENISSFLRRDSEIPPFDIMIGNWKHHLLENYDY